MYFPRGADDLLATLRTPGLDVLDGDARLPGPTLKEKLAKEAEDIDLALTPQTPEADSDPMRIYLRGDRVRGVSSSVRASSQGT